VSAPSHPDLRDQAGLGEIAERALLVGIDDESSATRVRLNDSANDAVLAMARVLHRACVARDQHEPFPVSERMFAS
jgi:hypothetical protein